MNARDIQRIEKEAIERYGKRPKVLVALHPLSEEEYEFFKMDLAVLGFDIYLCRNSDIVTELFIENEFDAVIIGTGERALETPALGDFLKFVDPSVHVIRYIPGKLFSITRVNIIETCQLERVLQWLFDRSIFFFPFIYDAEDLMIANYFNAHPKDAPTLRLCI